MVVPVPKPTCGRAARFVEAVPNPFGGLDELFLLSGEFLSGAITQIENDDILPKTTGNGRLRIFHFNDLHNHLTDLSGTTKGTHRIAQMVKIVRDARCQNNPKEAVLFLSLGDDHTGSVLDELLGWTPENFRCDASYRAYSAAGVDASILGNHEFDRGTALLAKSIQQDATFPVLSANVHSSKILKIGQDYYPAAIAMAGGMRIGLLGLTTHVETRVGQPDDPTLAVASPLSVLKNILPVLSDLSDIVIILSHCGFGDGAHQSGKAAAVRDIGEADFSIAKTATDISSKPMILLGAHTHTKLNNAAFETQNMIGRVPIFQAECNGRYLGEINLNVNASTANGLDILNAQLHPIKNQEASVKSDARNYHNVQQPGDYDQDFQAKTIEPMIAQVQDVLTAKIAHITTDELSFTNAALDRYAGECALLNFMADAVVKKLGDSEHDIDFALLNGATILAGIEIGTLTMGAWLDVMPYADEIFVARITSTELEKILDNNAKRLLRPDEIPETDHTGFVGRGFLHSSRELRYKIEPGTSAGVAKSKSIRFAGQPIFGVQQQSFNVAMPTYLALGAFGERWNGRPICGGVPGFLEGYDMRKLPSETTGLIFRNEIAAHISDLGEINDKTGSLRDGRLQIISQPKGRI